MGKFRLIWLCFLAQLLAFSATAGERLNEISATPSEARAGTRWWWMGSAVDEPNLRHLLKEYARAGIGSVEITPIYGVKGNEQSEIPFLSDKWMEMLRIVQDEAAKDGILVDMPTGTGWPFGGPDTPIQEAACKAVFVVDTVAAGAPTSKQISPKEKDFAYLETEKRYPISDGREQVIQLYVSRTLQQVKRAAPGGEGLVIDHFDKDAVKNYLQRIGNRFSQTGTQFPRNFFCDSYEVYGANWTPTLLKEFSARRGYLLEDHLRELIGLLPDGNKVLCDYRETLSEMLLENFSQQWTAWAHSHGAKTRCQGHGSPANLIDIYASVDIPEIEGFGLTDFGIKGLRTDPGMTRPNFSDVSMLKYASSAAHITGKPLVSSETFTWLTEHFRTSLSQMKPDLDLMFTCGVNHIYFHGTPYSPVSEPWPGWKFYASVDMSPTNSIWRDAPFLMKYINFCQTYLQKGTPDNDFLVYLPIRGMWHQRLDEREKGLLMLFDIHTMAEKAGDFIHTVLEIDSLGYDYDYISDKYLLGTTYSDGMIQTAAGTRYKALIIPEHGDISPALEKHISRLREQGATIILGVDAHKMSLAAKPEALRLQYGLRAIRRKIGKEHIYFIANLTPNDVDAYIPLAVNMKNVTVIDPLTEKATAAQVSGDAVRIALRSGQSCILESGVGDETVLRSQDTNTAQRMEIDLTDKPWTLSFLESAPKVNKTFRLKRLQSWETLSDDSARVTMGTGVYATTIRLNEKQAKRKWMLELGDVRESARVYINGEFLGCAWAAPFSLDCGSALKKGKNILRIEVTNLPANRIADLDRKGVEWRKFKDINMVNLRYQPSDYKDWEPVPSGLNSTVRLVEKR
ncbi:MAG: glycosyl hydrolase family 2 [Muribaculaceae bacterium]|nr:glycosyl hydrolase family 2 [Muribaculaceae bacterium]